MNTENTQPQEGGGYAAEPQELNLEDDTPLAPVCDLSGDGTCEACQ